VLGPGERLDQFEVVRVLGQGAYATTYLARDTLSGERVVLKLPVENSTATAETAARFAREAAIARRLRHPNLQGAAHALTPHGCPYLALEYVEGESLRQRLESGPPLSPTVAVGIGVQVAAGLAYAHAQGVVHRDLKPENILITSEGIAKIIDFGSARLLTGRRLTWRVRGETAGTPDYMAPEQVEGRRGDARTDVYALGVILYELVTGQVPFDGDNANAVMYQQLNAAPRPPSQLRPDLPAGLEAVIMKAMAKRPADRYQDAEATRRDLEEFAGAEARPDAAPPGTAEPWSARLARRLRQRSRP
jgi:serine/threonine-protein kinase